MSESRGGVGRRVFLRAAGAGAAAVAASRLSVGLAAAAEVDVVEATLADLQQRMASGRITARALTQAYLARIEALDRRGPELRSVIEINPDALAIADGARRRAQGERAARPAARHPGPAQGQHRHRRPHDHHRRLAGARGLDPAARRLRRRAAARGRAAILLGKTNLSEWANIRSTRSTSGWSARGGQCRNPYALDRNPCGSSSGSGAAVAANLCAAGGRHRDRRLDRLSRRRPAASSASSPPSGWSAARASSRSRTARTPPARWRAPCATRRVLLGALAGVDPRDAGDRRERGQRARRLHRGSSTRTACAGARIGVCAASSSASTRASTRSWRRRSRR